MITCPFCGTKNESGAEFCGNCGRPLVAVATPATPAPKATEAPQAAPPPTPASAWPAAASSSALAAVICPNCGETNHPSREFCWKCASELHPPPPPKPPSRFGRSFWVNFALSSLVGLAVVVGGATLLAPHTAASSPITLARPNGDPVEFAVQPGTPTPLGQLPTNSTIQLASYKQAAAATASVDSTGHAPWWNDTVPRIPPVSQFDGGPLAKVNCVMA
ncbi:MAG: Double zinc ribbon, partial [Chloroflexota bacterium]|nr:Double zinc ribbon [Chloroflexota bacterium]